MDDPRILGIVAKLNDTSPARRARAIREAIEVGAQASAVLPRLIELLADKNVRIRRLAGLAALKIDQTASVSLLVEALADTSRRAGAEEALSSLDSTALPLLPILVKALGHPDGRARKTLATTIARLGPAVVPLLLETIEGAVQPTARRADSAGANDTDRVREAALDTLARIGPAAAAARRTLSKFVLHESEVVASEVLQTLKKLGPSAVPAITAALTSGNRSTREDATRALAEMVTDAELATAAIIAALAAPFNSKSHVIGALARIGPSAVPSLIAVLSNFDPTVRGGAVEALGKIGPGAASGIQSVAGLVRDPDRSVRLCAIQAVTSILQPPAALTFLLDLLADSDRELRAMAVDHLASTHGDRMLDLVLALADPRPAVTRGVMLAILRFGPRAIPALIEASKRFAESSQRQPLDALEELAAQLEIVKYGEPRRGTKAESLSLYFDDLTEETLSSIPGIVQDLEDRLNADDRTRAPLYFSQPSAAELLPGVMRRVKARQAKLRELRDAIVNAYTTLATAAKVDPGVEVGEGRYTDLTIFEGHVYPIEDPSSFVRLKDESPLRFRCRYTLEVAIRKNRSGISAEVLPPRAAKEPGGSEATPCVHVTVRAVGEGIEISEGFEQLTWPRGSDSEPAYFRFETLDNLNKVSAASLEVRIYDQSLDLLDIVNLDVTIVPDGWLADEPGVRPRRLRWPALSLPQAITPGDGQPRGLSIHVRHTSRGYQFECVASLEGRSMQVIFVRDIRQGDLEQLLCAIRDFWTELAITTYSSTVSVTQSTFTSHLKRAAELGQRAWSLLFGRRRGSQIGASERFAEFLASSAPSDGARIQITHNPGPRSLVFPWNILYPDSEGPVDPLLFWGARYRIEQVTSGPKAELEDGPVRVAFVLDPKFALASSQDALFKSYRERAGSRLTVEGPLSDQSALFDALVRVPAADVVYFFCHGYTADGPGSTRPDAALAMQKRIEAVPEKNPMRAALQTLLDLVMRAGDESCLYVGSSEIKLSTLNGNRNFFGERRPIVFMNVCQSAAIVPSMSSSFVSVFLDHDASAVIGTESPMTSVFADSFATRFFDALFGGLDVGTALLQARRYFLSQDQRNPLGLAYTLYGRSSARVCTTPLIPQTDSMSID